MFLKPSLPQYTLCPRLTCSARRSRINAYFSSQSANFQAASSSSGPSASAKLFADAEKEESSSNQVKKSQRLQLLESQGENWTGDERVQDAVLRMLVDKYKPLRTGTIQSAEQKLKRNPHVINAGVVPEAGNGQLSGGGESATGIGAPSVTVNSIGSSPSTGSWATEQLIPSIEGHRPWHTTFKAPSHDAPSVKLASIPTRPNKPPAIAIDGRSAQTVDRKAQKRKELAGRVANARESTLDYRLGIKGAQASTQHHGLRPNPVNIRAWASLVEDRIEKARINGLFNNIKGRGQPITRASDEHNPFIAREEFLMNRIVQKNGAAPPWVEVQQEVESAINSFRGILRQAWTRHALRSLTVGFHSYPGAHQRTLVELQALRDGNWEKREFNYHTAAIAEINALVRKYNTVAPYAVRRPLYTREAELERAYKDSGEDILQGLEERKKLLVLGGRTRGVDEEEKGGSNGNWGEENADALPFSGVFRHWVEKVTAWVRGK
ncbi:hypothetical protein EYR36_008015 [Pleurotus pulmonarius]|nr:hypothetical protein EYR36_008015 [Pleurotus pulmonarius]